MKFKLVKFALLVGVGAFFINACLSTKPAPIKRESTTPSPQSAAVQQMPVLVDFSDELKFKQLQNIFFSHGILPPNLIYSFADAVK